MRVRRLMLCNSSNINCRNSIITHSPGMYDYPFFFSFDCSWFSIKADFDGRGMNESRTPMVGIGRKPSEARGPHEMYAPSS